MKASYTSRFGENAPEEEQGSSHVTKAARVDPHEPATSPPSAPSGPFPLAPLLPELHEVVEQWLDPSSLLSWSLASSGLAQRLHSQTLVFSPTELLISAVESGNKEQLRLQARRFAEIPSHLWVEIGQVLSPSIHFKVVKLVMKGKNPSRELAKLVEGAAKSGNKSMLQWFMQTFPSLFNEDLLEGLGFITAGMDNPILLQIFFPPTLDASNYEQIEEIYLTAQESNSNNVVAVLEGPPYNHYSSSPLNLQALAIVRWGNLERLDLLFQADVKCRWMSEQLYTEAIEGGHLHLLNYLLALPGDKRAKPISKWPALLPGKALKAALHAPHTIKQLLPQFHYYWNDKDWRTKTLKETDQTIIEKLLSSTEEVEEFVNLLSLQVDWRALFLEAVKLHKTAVIEQALRSLALEGDALKELLQLGCEVAVAHGKLKLFKSLKKKLGNTSLTTEKMDMSPSRSWMVPWLLDQGVHIDPALFARLCRHPRFLDFLGRRIAWEDAHPPTGQVPTRDLIPARLLSDQEAREVLDHLRQRYHFRPVQIEAFKRLVRLGLLFNVASPNLVQYGLSLKDAAFLLALHELGLTSDLLDRLFEREDVESLRWFFSQPGLVAVHVDPSKSYVGLLLTSLLNSIARNEKIKRRRLQRIKRIIKTLVYHGLDMLPSADAPVCGLWKQLKKQRVPLGVRDLCDGCLN